MKRDIEKVTESILMHTEGDLDFTKRLTAVLAGKPLYQTVVDVVKECEYIETAEDLYDELISRKGHHLPSALRNRLAERFGDIAYEREWESDAELRKALTKRGINHPDAYAPACFILHAAFPNAQRDGIIAAVNDAHIEIKRGILSTDELLLVSDIAKKSDELRKQLVALIQAFLPSKPGSSVISTGSVISRYQFTFDEVMTLMSKLKYTNTEEAEAALRAIEAEHANDIHCAADFFKFI